MTAHVPYVAMVVSLSLSGMAPAYLVARRLVVVSYVFPT